ncbi:TetR/AcrR family transcriptional regulator [Halanaerobaculum tunisiense]
MAKKELIRQSAIKIIAQEGYYNTTVKMIAEQANVAVGTVYNYFSNKKEILNHIFAIEFDKRIKLLQKLKEDEALSLKEKLVSFLDQHFNDLKSNPATTTVLVQESNLPSNHSLAAVDDFMNQLPDLLAKMIGQAQAKGEIREVNSELIATAIFNTIRGVAMKVAQNDDFSFPQAKKIINQIWLGLGK